MKNKYIILLTFACTAFSLSLFAQKAKEKESTTEKLYKDYGYQEVINSSGNGKSKFTSNNSEISVQDAIKLGDSYRLTADYANAAYWYGIVVAQSDVAIYKLYYGQALISLGQCELAKKYLLEYDQVSDAKDRNIGKKLAASCETQFEERADVLLSPAPFNSVKQDFSPIETNDGWMFVSNRKHTKSFKYNKKDVWVSDNFTDLWLAKRSSAGYDKAEPIPGIVNDKFHEGSACMADNRTLFFTRSQYFKRKRIFDNAKTTKLGIYSATQMNGEWGNIIPFQYNSKDNSVCHPTVDNLGSTMIFASDLAGGFGGFDLYVTYYDNGKWTEPQNLGETINTGGNEVFPFLSKSGDLYYSSNGLSGMGGLDIYSATRKKKNDFENWNTPQNMGLPFNSNEDDFGFYLSEDAHTGALSSNRVGGKGKDDIYLFETITPLKAKQEVVKKDTVVAEKPKVPHLEGIVVNKTYKNHPVPDIAVVILNKCTGQETTIITDKDGRYNYNVECDCDYVLKTSKPLFEDGFDELTIDDIKCKKIAIPHILTIGNKLSDTERLKKGDVFELKNVFYNFDKYDVRSDATEDLDELIELMKAFPELEIQLASHTDSRGSHHYNMKLSENRAASVKEYLIRNGISGNRISTIGYGESKLRNNCADGVDCSETEHQYNRRTEVKITEMGKSVINVIYIDNKPKFIDPKKK